MKLLEQIVATLHSCYVHYEICKNVATDGHNLQLAGRPAFGILGLQAAGG